MKRCDGGGRVYAVYVVCYIIQDDDRFADLMSDGKAVMLDRVICMD